MLNNSQGMTYPSGAEAPSRLSKTERLNVNSLERFLSLFGGALLAIYGLSRRSFGGLSIALTGGYMVYRGLTGHCSVYESLGINTASSNRSQFDNGDQDQPGNTTDDMVDEMVWQTFPASDAPATW